MSLTAFQSLVLPFSRDLSALLTATAMTACVAFVAGMRNRTASLYGHSLVRAAASWTPSLLSGVEKESQSVIANFRLASSHAYLHLSDSDLFIACQLYPHLEETLKRPD